MLYIIPSLASITPWTSTISNSTNYSTTSTTKAHNSTSTLYCTPSPAPPPLSSTISRSTKSPSTPIPPNSTTPTPWTTSTTSTSKSRSCCIPVKRSAVCLTTSIPHLTPIPTASYGDQCRGSFKCVPPPPPPLTNPRKRAPNNKDPRRSYNLR